MRIHVGADHAGFELKEHVKARLAELGNDVTDVGTYSEESVDYPDFAAEVARAVARGDADSGILVCGTGLGMAIAANKVPGVRAVQASDLEVAVMARRHNNANVLTLPGRYMSPEVADEVVAAFLGTEYEGGRHQRRIDKISALEERGL
ncbi:MAG: ribose 5-phosphate isomerase B [Coriobacteriia bacterium]|nr:ribose 5-phosphate isomerase B [Coriobacteriia bacterium]